MTTSLLLGLLLAATIERSARDVALTVSPARPTDQGEAKECEVVGIPVGGAAELLVRAQRVSAPCPSVPCTQTLHLPDGLVWDLRLVCASHWAAPSTFYAGASANPSALKAWRSAEVGGTLRSGEGVDLPSEIAVRFMAPTKPAADREPTQEGEPAVEPVGEVTCSVGPDHRFTCRVPAAHLDLRLHARGFVSRHLWDENLVPAARREVGVWTLVPGAAVAGRVLMDDDRLPAVGCEVELSALPTGPPNPSLLARVGRVGATAKTDKHGLFVLEGLTPGRYSLTARMDGFAPTRLSPLTVLERAETEIRDPLVLMRPLSLRIAVTPATDPARQPWTVTVLEAGILPSVWDITFETSVGPDGTIVRSGLRPGHYMAMVMDRIGSLMLRREFDLAPQSGDVSLEVASLIVAGSLRLGKKPLSADLTFGSPRGASISMQSDEKGEFSGSLAGAGAWQVRVEAKEPRVRRTLRDVKVEPSEGGEARVDLELPSTEVAGKVVDERGSAVEGARVSVSEMGSQSGAETFADRAGQFALAGVAEGRLILQASHVESGERFESEPVWVTIAEGVTPRPTTLVLRRDSEIVGRVVSHLGQGVPLAQVWSLAPAVGTIGAAPLGRATTDLAGDFRLPLSPGAAAASLLAMAPGFALRAAPWMRSDSATFQIRVDPYGGTLRLDMAELSRADAPRGVDVVVFQDGAPLWVGFLDVWARLNGQQASGETVRTIPSMAAGSYRACPVAMSTMSIGRCSEGYLSPGGDLVLRVPRLR